MVKKTQIYPIISFTVILILSDGLQGTGRRVEGQRGAMRAAAGQHQVIHKWKAAELSHVTYIRGINGLKKSLSYRFAGCKLEN